jgi:hypothetical protein
MNQFFRLAVLICGATFLAACDTGPNGFGTAPQGVSQADWDAQQKAKREAFHKCMSGSRPGGGSGGCYALR